MLNRILPTLGILSIIMTINHVVMNKTIVSSITYSGNHTVVLGINLNNNSLIIICTKYIAKE